MGATLPAISRWVKATPEGVSWLGFFYGGNIAGGVFGCVLAGFYLLRVFDVATATMVGGRDQRRRSPLIAYVLAGRTTYEADVVDASRAGAGAAATRAVYVDDRAVGPDRAGRRGDLDAPAVAAFRRHGLHLRADPRGVPGRPRHRQHVSARRWRATSCRRGARSAGASCCCAARSRGPRTSSPSRCRTGRSTRTSRRRRGSRCSSIWSAASGWCCRARCSGARAFRWRWRRSRPTEQDAARLAGGVYAANTVGAIAGSLVTSFVLIPWIGTSHAEQVVIIVSALSALIMLEPSFAGAAARPAGFMPEPSEREARLEHRRHRVAGDRDGRRRAARAQRPPAARPAGRLRPLLRDAHRPGRHHLRRRGAERVGRRVASCPTACAITTTPARSRRRASRRTCGCSACSAT